MYLTIYKIKNGGHWQSWGGHFFGVPSLRGAEGGTPPLFRNLFSAKSCLIGISEKSKGFGTFRTPDKGAIRNFPRGWLNQPPSVGGRVNEENVGGV